MYKYVNVCTSKEWHSHLNWSNDHGWRGLLRKIQSFNIVTSHETHRHNDIKCITLYIIHCTLYIVHCTLHFIALLFILNIYCWKGHDPMSSIQDHDPISSIQDHDPISSIQDHDLISHCTCVNTISCFGLSLKNVIISYWVAHVWWWWFENNKENDWKEKNHWIDYWCFIISNCMTLIMIMVMGIIIMFYCCVHCLNNNDHHDNAMLSKSKQINLLK